MVSRASAHQCYGMLFYFVQRLGDRLVSRLCQHLGAQRVEPDLLSSEGLGETKWTLEPGCSGSEHPCVSSFLKRTHFIEKR